MFDAIVSTIMIQGNLNKLINSRSDSKVEIKGNGEFLKEVLPEWYTVDITKSFYKQIDCEVGAAVVCQVKELKGSDGIVVVGA